MESFLDRLDKAQETCVVRQVPDFDKKPPEMPSDPCRDYPLAIVFDSDIG